MTVFDLLISFVLTWSVGLGAPAFVRYVIVRRPLLRYQALGWAIGLFLAEVVLWTLLGSQSKTHAASILVAVFAFRILQSQTGPWDDAERMTPRRREIAMTTERAGRKEIILTVVSSVVVAIAMLLIWGMTGPSMVQLGVLLPGLVIMIPILRAIWQRPALQMTGYVAFAGTFICFWIAAAEDLEPPFTEEQWRLLGWTLLVAATAITWRQRTPSFAAPAVPTTERVSSPTPRPKSDAQEMGAHPRGSHTTWRCPHCRRLNRPGTAVCACGQLYGPAGHGGATDASIPPPSRTDGHAQATGGGDSTGVGGVQLGENEPVSIQASSVEPTTGRVSSPTPLPKSDGIRKVTMATKKLGTMSAEMRWLDRGCLALAFLIMLVVTFALRPESPTYLSFEAMIYLTFEALGGLLPAALPAWMAHTWAKQPAPYHVFTLGLALMVAFGHFYGATH